VKYKGYFSFAVLVCLIIWIWLHVAIDKEMLIQLWQDDGRYAIWKAVQQRLQHLPRRGSMNHCPAVGPLEERQLRSERISGRR
jgi:hypothetical protein